jgi:hypothetical protein
MTFFILGRERSCSWDTSLMRSLRIDDTTHHQEIATSIGRFGGRE